MKSLKARLDLLKLKEKRHSGKEKIKVIQNKTKPNKNKERKNKGS